MVKNTKNNEVDEPTVKFAEDGPEYKISDMTDEARDLFVRWQEKRRVRDDFVIKANNDIDDLNRLMASYEAQLKSILQADNKIEVSK